MKNICNLYIVALLLYIADCKITTEQMEKSGAMVRTVCQPKTKVTDELIAGVNAGKFPDDKSIKCYAHCCLEMMNLMKKNKINYEAAMKQFDMLLPEELLEPYKRSLSICKDAINGIKDACEAGYTLVQCIYNNNPHFMFP